MLENLGKLGKGRGGITDGCGIAAPRIQYAGANILTWDAIAVAIQPPPPIIIAGKDMLTIRHAATGTMVAAWDTDGGEDAVIYGGAGG